MGDLSVIGNDREAMKAKVRAAFPDAKPGAIPNIAGTLLTFAYRMLPGDLVVYVVDRGPDEA
jgi:restriction system protein